jgi:hypothetical protein
MRLVYHLLRQGMPLVAFQWAHRTESISRERSLFHNITMLRTIADIDDDVTPTPIPGTSNGTSQTSIHQLKAESEMEVLDFLTGRPPQSIFMIGLIRDNGIVSPLNNGKFYAYRNSNGEIEGVGLIGQLTMFETKTKTATENIAKLSREKLLIRKILGEPEKLKEFWMTFEPLKPFPDTTCQDLLMEQRQSNDIGEMVRGLRQATINDLTIIMQANARLASERNNINSMLVDPLRFRLYSVRVIEQGRVWMWVENNKLIFKADILADTRGAICLDNLYIDSDDSRNEYYSLLCLSQLSGQLLKSSDSVCVLVNEKNQRLQDLCTKAGFSLRERYQTVSL